MARAYRSASGRIQQRRAGGQFRRSTLADVGLASTPCPSCGAVNPREIGLPPPVTCPACGERLQAACPEHGDACGLGCAARPCERCGGTGPQPKFIDPAKIRTMCKACGRVPLTGES